VIYFGGMQQYIEFDGINLNASNTVYGTVKIEGWSGGNAHHIRIKNAELIGQKDGKADGLSGPMQILASASVPGIIGGNEFINLTIHGGGDPGDFAYAFYFNSSDNLVEGCNIYDVSGAGVHIYNGYGVAANNNIIRNNIIHDITRSGDDRTWGVVVSNGSGNKVYNNIIYNIQSTQSFGIRVYSPNNEVYNNTVYNVRQFGIEVLSAASGTILKNNVAHGNGANYMNRATGTIASNNSFNGIDPRFVNPSAGDFRVQSTSPLVDAGTIVAAVTADAVGVPRPQLGAYDIGAFEFSGEQASPSAPTNVRISSR
jgi:parallel beta-helix repeat protein